MRSILMTLGAVATALALATPAGAGGPTDQVRQYTDHVQRILDDAELKQADKRAAVRKVAEQVFDLTETAKRALGPHWNRRTPAEQEEFVHLFADILERAYISKIDLYGGEKLQYTNEIIDGDYATVRARLFTRQRAEVPVEAKLHRRGDRWLIYDVSIEHVSLVGNYRSQFDRIIRTSSFAELVKRLKTKRDEFLPSQEARPHRS
ncbi:MAG: MlaC/ttg2D family ABC transporter substrate-binding protein [Candidatus Rokuibacteriota bacterium]